MELKTQHKFNFYLKRKFNLNIQKSGKSAMTWHLKRLNCSERADYKEKTQPANLILESQSGYEIKRADF